MKFEEQRRRHRVSSLENLFMASICRSSSNSMRATGMPLWIVITVVLTGALDGRKGADRRRDLLGNAVEPECHLGDDAERALASRQRAGSGRSPRPICARRRAVRMTRPSASTTVSDSTFSRMVP